MPADLTFHNDSFSQGNEPRLQDILLALSSLDMGINAKITALDTKFDAMFRSILQREDNIDARLRVVEQRITKVESKIEDLQDDLTTALAAIDQDSITIINHGHRISKLEMIIA